VFCYLLTHLYYTCIAVLRLHRSASLTHVTTLLREQLDHATTANQSLSAEVNKLNALREEFEVREAEFKKEEQVDKSVSFF
jgi:Ciliary rootlet component, centrosome cohesion